MRSFSFTLLLPPHDPVRILETVPVLLLWFFTFSLRIILLKWPVWSTYIPIVSPVYGSGPAWLSSRRREVAIIVHVVAGAIALVSGGVQLDKTIRRGWPSFHRWSGRVYCLMGFISIVALRELRATTGLREEDFSTVSDVTPGNNLSMRLFVDAASLAWIGCMLAAWFEVAVRRDIERHRRWAVGSYFILLTPILQRFSVVVFTTVALVIKLQIDACFEVPFWNSAWGTVPPPDVSPMNAFRSTWIPRRPSDHVEGQAGPRVLTFEGYGVAENEVFALSAWAGLIIMLLAALLFWTPLTSEEKEKHDDGSKEPLVFQSDNANSQTAIDSTRHQDSLISGTHDIDSDPVPNFKMLAKVQELTNEMLPFQTLIEMKKKWSGMRDENEALWPLSSGLPISELLSRAPALIVISLAVFLAPPMIVILSTIGTLAVVSVLAVSFTTVGVLLSIPLFLAVRLSSLLV